MVGFGMGPLGGSGGGSTGNGVGFGMGSLEATSGGGTNDYNDLINKPIDLVFEVASLSELTHEERSTITAQIVDNYVAGKAIDDYVLKYSGVTERSYHYASFVDDTAYITFIFRGETEEITLKVALEMVGYEYTSIDSRVIQSEGLMTSAGLLIGEYLLLEVPEEWL